MPALYESIKAHIEAYVKEIWNRKIRLVIAAVVFAVLSVMSFTYLYSGGIDKKIILALGLCFVTAACIVAPRIKNSYVTLGLTILYLIIVPKKMFERIELPTHDLSRLIDGAALVNILIIFLIYAVLLLVSQNVGVALGTGGIITGILFVINYFVREFRGTSLGFYDFFAVKTAATVMQSYELTMSSELWYSILYFLCFIAVGFWCGTVWKNQRKWFHIAISVISVAYIGFFAYFWFGTDYLEEHQLKGVHWTPSENQPLDGFLLSFGINIQEMYVAKPAGYSKEALREIGEQAKASYTAPDLGTSVQQPNIIMIMNESWSDLGVLGHLETSTSYMTTVESLEENVIKGYVHANILGGLTANSEFEALTGDSQAFLAKNAVPYQLQVDHAMPSLATVLKEQGYRTLAMHPSVNFAWNREEVYEYFGFEDFVDVYDFQTEYEHVRAYISDTCNYNEIIHRFENKEEGAPLFVFDVTIQNHGGYGWSLGVPISIEKLGDGEPSTYGDISDAQSFIELMEITDKSFAELIAYFEQVEEPTIICMFGDHQPSLGDDFYNAVFSGSDLTAAEQEALKYITPYVIWANYDVDFPEYGDMSINYLGAALLECAGVELPPYYKFLLQMQKQYPVITYTTINGIRNEDTIEKYQMLQYNHLIDKDSVESLFAVE